MKIRNRFAVLFAVCLLAAGALLAQNGTIQGAVLDPQSAAVANAKISVTDQSKGVLVRETMTSETGVFRLVELLRGTYTLKIEAAGLRRNAEAETQLKLALAKDPTDIEARYFLAGVRARP